ncbi:MAG: DUF3291 domain-containing protein [Hyphomicrobiales bacterium]
METGHSMQLAELNIARLKHPLDDPRVTEFVRNLERVNAIADKMPGFVWRLQDEGGNATSIRISDDAQVIVNLSVWETPQALETFVFQTVHSQFYKRRAEWFEVMGKPAVVMWWIDPGHRPTLEEAAARLRDLTDNGPSERAFGWAQLIDTERWRTQRCA